MGMIEKIKQNRLKISYMAAMMALGLLSGQLIVSDFKEGDLFQMGGGLVALLAIGYHPYYLWMLTKQREVNDG